MHRVRNEWKSSIYPMVPGHEIVGEVAEVGSDMANLLVGDIVGVGCIIDSCRTCEPRKAGE
jgi:alcohol dehydrogenase (NADP+)